MSTSVTRKIRNPRLTPEQEYEEQRKTEYHRIVKGIIDNLNQFEKYSHCLVEESEWSDDMGCYQDLMEECCCPKHRWFSIDNELYDSGFRYGDY